MAYAVELVSINRLNCLEGHSNIDCMREDFGVGVSPELCHLSVSLFPLRDCLSHFIVIFSEQCHAKTA